LGLPLPNAGCSALDTLYRSAPAEQLHLGRRQFGRDVVVQAGYWRFWQHLAHTLDVPIQGFVSDAKESIRLALQAACPDQPHHCCHYHCLRDAGSLTFEADRSMKTTLKQRLRSPLSRLEASIAKLPGDDAWRPILADYALAVRATLLEGGVAPFALGGVHVFDDLSALAASLQRCRGKGGIGSWSA
jgi:hypothetical protein